MMLFYFIFILFCFFTCLLIFNIVYKCDNINLSVMKYKKKKKNGEESEGRGGKKKWYQKNEMSEMTWLCIAVHLIIE